ncbi:MAG: PQQ-dependent sugar dehydrogenase [Candidatus Thiodiazotropha sp. (ex Codakia rugifera)]|nr:PQQ-dependent sugar dehydrogenase [Candidatus Thiodiazotropha sp. (ex Codakia rugifera)]
MTHPILILCVLVALLQLTHVVASPVIQTEKHAISYQVITSGLSHPWSIAFLPDGKILVSERGGNLRLIDSQGDLEPAPIKGVPPIRQHGQGGLLDIVIHPDFINNQWVYFSYAESDGYRVGTTVSRGRLKNRQLEQVEVIFQMDRKTKARQHFGSRLVFDRQGYLYITLGDRGDRPRAQDLNDHAGSLIRLHDDGRVPQDNPFIGISGVKPEIYSYGHRNMQGAALNPQTGKVWTHEHGPQGGDEINVPDAGLNYGWPVISYGVNYVIGTKIGEGSHKKGMVQPIHYWIPSIAPSGMAFYTGNAFKGWQGNLFVGSLKFQQLVRLELDGETITHEERLLSDELGRIRDVRQGPDGLIYLVTDEENGKLVRLSPSPES